MSALKEGESTTSTVVAPSSPQIEPVRHTKYYYEDGDCILEAGDKLFKLHRFLFTRDSRILNYNLQMLDKHTTANGTSQKDGDMGKSPPKGSCDENPIVWYEPVETLEELCWGLYLKHTEVQAQDKPQSLDLHKMIKLASVSLKYGFGDLHQWATSVLNYHCTTNTTHGSRSFLQTRSQNELESLLQLAFQLRMSALTAIENEWITRMPTYLQSTVALRAALEFAENPSLRGFKARAYHATLKYGSKFNLSGARPKEKQGINDIFSPQLDDPDHVISLLPHQQVQCLYRGLWALLSLGQKLRVIPPPEQQPSCNDRRHKSRCIPCWKSLWKEDDKSKGQQTIDPKELIDDAFNKLNSKQDSQDIGCYGLMKVNLDTIKTKFDRKLLECFA